MTILTLVAHWLRSRRPRARLALAAAFGALAALAMPPIYAAPLLWIAFPALLWLAEGARTRWGAFAVGWAFGVGHFALGLYWLSYSLFTDIARWWWVLPFSALGLPVLLGVFTGAATLLPHWAGARGLARATLFAVAWGGAEWLRGHVLTGFPWNLTAHGWIGWPALLQGYALVGSYGMGLVTVLAASWVVGLSGGPHPNPPPPSSREDVDPKLFPGFAGEGWVGAIRSPVLAILPSLALLVLAAWGVARLPAGPAPTVPDIRLRLVQPNVSLFAKHDPASGTERLFDLMRLIAAPAGDGEPAPNVIILPETSVPGVLDREPAVMDALRRVLPPRAVLLAGTLRAEGEGEQADYYNSLQVLDGSDRTNLYYDKAHLVPFGEYMPMRRLLHLDAIAAGFDLAAGPGRRTLRVPGVPPVSPLICYEIIYPAEAVDPADRPDWLVTITNDAWFGDSAGPQQHFAMARARAVEEGLPVARAANTGISGTIDPYGRVLARTRIDTRGVLDTPLPAKLPATPYANNGDTSFAAAMGFLAATALIATYRCKKTRPHPIHD